MNQIPFLFTWDVDPLTIQERVRIGLNLNKSSKELMKASLEKSTYLIENLGIKTTFFFTSVVAKEIEKELHILLDLGHEIGCHGYDHTEKVDLNKLSYDRQYKKIKKATRILEDIVGNEIKSFRAPRLKINHITLQILEELGYTADVSIPSQRFDIVSSNLINPHWLVAPRVPYHPSKNNAFTKGDMNIWEIPISAIFLPFISGTMAVFGKQFLYRLFRLLYFETKFNNHKPIVFLIHPHELIAEQAVIKERTVRERHSLNSLKTTGIPMRFKFFNHNGEKLLQQTIDLFTSISNNSNLQFLRVRDYVNLLENSS